MGVQVEGTRAIAERGQVVHTERVHHAEHGIRHRRAVRRLDVQVAGETILGLAEQHERAATMIVHVRVAHRRPVNDHRLIEHVALAFLDTLELVEEVRQHRHVILVEQLEVAHPLLAAAMVRRRMEALVGAALRIRTAGAVAAHLEREHARDIGRERERLNVNKDNFNEVMASQNLKLDLKVDNRLEDSEEGSQLQVSLDVRSLKDLEPDAIAKNVPELRKLLEMREALTALKGPLGNMPAFKAAMEKLLTDEESRNQLLAELEKKS